MGDNNINNIEGPGAYITYVLKFGYVIAYIHALLSPMHAAPVQLK